MKVILVNGSPHETGTTRVGLDEIAKMLKRPASTVRNQLRDARTRLKEKLGGDPDEE